MTTLAPDPRDPPLPPNWQEIDALESYNVAVKAIGERVRAGAPVPEFMKSRKATGANPTGTNALTPQEIPASVTHNSTGVTTGTLFDHMDAAKWVKSACRYIFDRIPALRDLRCVARIEAEEVIINATADAIDDYSARREAAE